MKLKNLAFFAFFMLLSSISFASSNYQGSWAGQSSGIMLASGLMDIKIVNNSLIYAVGFNGKAIKYTGRGWSRLSSSNISAAETLAAVYTFDTSNAYILGQGSSRYYLHKTANAGLSFINTEITGNVNSIIRGYFLTTQEGWIVGNGGGGVTGNAGHTLDGGTSFTVQTISSQDVTLYDVYFIDSNKGWVCGGKPFGAASQGVIYRTINGGTSWAECSIPLAGILFSMSFANENVGWATGQGGVILNTIDGGANWTLQTSEAYLTVTSLNEIKFVNENVGWVVGDSGKNFMTSDGGSNWISQSISSVSSSILGVDLYPGSAHLWFAGIDLTNPTTAEVLYSYAQPSITNVSPSTLQLGASNTVTITGTNFWNNATISSISGITISGVNVASSKEITATLAVSSAATTGARSITVVNPDTTDATYRNAITISSPTSTSLSISLVSPSSIIQGSTETVTVTGSGFQQGLTVAFSGNGLSAQSISSVSTTEIIMSASASSDADIGGHNLVITNQDGGSTIEANAMVVLSSTTSDNPSITKVVPGSGCIGQTVNIAVNGSIFPYPLNDKIISLDFADSGIAVSNIEVLSSTQIAAKLALNTTNITLGNHSLTLTVKDVLNVAVGSAVKNDAFTVNLAGSGAIIIPTKNPFNPAKDGHLTLQIEVYESGNFELVIANPEKVIYKKDVALTAGFNKVSISVDSYMFANGIYLVPLFKDKKLLGKTMLMVFQ